MSTEGTGTLVCALVIPSDHAAYTGHFPSFAILPGAVLLDEALQEIARSRRLDLLTWRLQSAKFLEIVRPDMALTLEHSPTGTTAIRFSIRNKASLVATGTLAATDGRHEA